MINYSDVIVKKGEKPEIVFNSKNDKKLIGSPVTIYHGSKIIHQTKYNDCGNKIILPEFDNDLVELSIEIITKPGSFTFPLTIMRLDQTTPYIICDIDFTVSATSLYGYITNNLLHMKMILNSCSVLNNLAPYFKIIYLTGRYHCYTKLTKLWIKKNAFPDGPMLSRKNETSLQLKQYKVKALDKIVSINPNGIGIGDLKSDIKAYLHHNLNAIKIIHPIVSKRNSSYSQENNLYYTVKSWLGIEQLFKDKFINRS